ncbi:MAG: TRAP transporter TatT component family protein [candidate division KSB1 bacterium]|nr:TRAP transporter TatT component family protein [candidate division KSB1 bacterium]
MRKILIVSGLIVTLSGCSLQKMAIRSTGGILDYSLTALYEEDDLRLAEQAIASDLKLLEGLIKGDPGNEQFLLLAAQGYGSYALGFAEDEDPLRARKFYRRGRDYGLQLLEQKKAFRLKDLETIQSTLRSFTEKDVPALFWTAYDWAGWINLSLTDPVALADLPKVQAMMHRVLELDEGYFYGGAHLFFGTILAARPRMLGGNPQKAQEHFQRCLELNQGKFLMTQLYYARFYAVQVQDQKLFQNLLQQVLDASLDLLPEQRLANALAKEKAKRLLQKMEELF